MKEQKILVTGATGFVGGHVVAALQAQGYPLRVLVRTPAKAEKLKAGGVEIAAGDIFEPPSLAKAAREMNTVIHLVGIIQEVGRATFERVHVAGTHNVLAAAQAAGVPRFLYISGLGAGPRAPAKYHRTKYAAEEAVRASGLEYLIFRPSVLCGPGDGFVSLLLKMIRTSPVVPIIGDGRYQLQPLYIQDLCTCILRGLEDPSVWNQTFEIGGADALEYNQILHLLLQHLGKSRLKIHIPLSLMKIQVKLMEKVLSRPPLSSDQLIIMAGGNTCDITAVKKAFKLEPLGFKETIEKYV